MLTQIELAFQACSRNPTFIVEIIFACLATLLQISNTIAALYNASATSYKHYSPALFMMLCSFIASMTIVMQVLVYHLNAAQKSLYIVYGLLRTLNTVRLFFTLLSLGGNSILALEKFDKLIPHTLKHGKIMKIMKTIHLVVSLMCVSIVTGGSVMRDSLDAMEYDDIILIGYLMWAYTYDMAITTLFFEKESDIKEKLIDGIVSDRLMDQEYGRKKVIKDKMGLFKRLVLYIKINFSLMVSIGVMLFTNYVFVRPNSLTQFWTVSVIINFLITVYNFVILKQKKIIEEVF